jgi:thymidylate synthase
MKNYLHLLREILEHGQEKPDRTGTGTRSLFGKQLRFDLREGFPAVTTKKLFFKGVVVELLWMLRGETNIKFLHEHGVTIWDEWADKDGSLGPVYPEQWRHWGRDTLEDQGIDQIAGVLNSLSSNPHGRRHIVTAWDPEAVPHCALPPCHCFFQVYVGGPASDELSCMMTQRSADVFLGLPFNIASYALLTHIVAAHCGYRVGDLIISLGDVHLYQTHTEQAWKQLLRSPRRLPALDMPRIQGDLKSLNPDDFQLVGYDPYPPIPAPVAV